MIARGVLAGANRPCMVTASNFASPDSSMVGTSGSSGVLARLVTASARSCPDRSCASTYEVAATTSGTSPLTAAATDGAPPL